MTLSISMNDSKRKLKQAFFGFIFIFLTAGPLLYYYFAGFGNSACFNNEWDIDEEGVDCGGPCAACLADIPPQGVSNFKQIKTVIVPAAAGSYDLVGEIENPNIDWGAESLDFRFTLFDANNEAIIYIDGTDFIMPGNTSHKYIVKHVSNLQTKPNSVKLMLTKIKWKKFPDYLSRPVFFISYKSFKENGNAVSAEGELRNSSINGFNEVSVSVIARGSDGNIIGAATTDMSTLKSEEKRYFKLTWDNTFEERVNENNVEWNVQVNILREDNFMEKIYEPVKENL